MPGELSRDVLLLMQTLWDLFDDDARWPLIRDLSTELDHQHGLDLERVLERVPREFIYGVGPHRLPSDDEEVGLTFVGASKLGTTGEILQIVVDAIRSAALLQESWVPPRGQRQAELVFAAKDVPLPPDRSSAVTAAILEKVGALLIQEQWGWRSASRGTSPGQWSFSIDRTVRRFRGVVDVADYLQRAHPGGHWSQVTGATGVSARMANVDQDVQITADDGSVVTGRRVFLVHGRDHAARDSLIELLRAFDLKVVSWREAAARAPGGGSPYTGDIVRAGMDQADAVVVLLTPDDVGYVRPNFREPRDGTDDLQPTGQARLNVIFEAGMAMAIDRNKVVLVEVGATRGLTDTAGINTIRLRNHVESRKDFASRLRSCGLVVDSEGELWRTVGDFDRATLTDADLGVAQHDGLGIEGRGGSGSPKVAEQVRLSSSLMASKLGQLVSNFSTDVVGEITNESDRPINTVMLGATFYDDGDRIVGTADGFVNGLEAKQTKSFRLTSAGIIERAARFTIQSNGAV